MHSLDQHADFVARWPHDAFTTLNPTAFGMEVRRVTFANTEFAFEGLDTRLAQAFDRHYAGLRHEPDRDVPGVKVRYCACARDVFRSPNTRGWQYDLGLSFDAQSVVMTGINYLVTCKRTSLETTIFVGPELSDPIDVIENPFRMVCAQRLLQMNGVMLHSAGFALGSRAVVCWGRSGAGKSTLSGIVKEDGFRVLSDELNALMPTKDGILVQAMPFAGDLGRTEAPLQTYDLAGLFTLQQAVEPALFELRRAQALGTMAAASPFINADPQLDERLFDVLGALLTGYRAQTLAFPKSETAAQFIRRAVFE